MNQIEKTDRYELDAEHKSTPVKRQSDMLHVTNRQVSWLTASLVLLSFFVFMAGYFLGQRKALEHVHKNTDQEAFADNVYANACALAEPAVCNQLETVVSSEVAIEKPPTSKEVVGEADQQYYAQLIGFGTSRAAYKFADRMQQKNIPVAVKERHSRTAQGKKIIWYQVVTEQFAQRDDLVAFIETIKRKEKLHDIRIVAC